MGNMGLVLPGMTAMIKLPNSSSVVTCQIKWSKTEGHQQTAGIQIYADDLGPLGTIYEDALLAYLRELAG